jgi:PD-(D/E)XK nuclease superfamily protein
LKSTTDKPWWDFNHEDALVEARERIQPLIDRFVGMSEDLGMLMSWMYAGHVAAWGVDEEWRIIDVERAGQVPLNPPAADHLGNFLSPFDNAVGLFEFKYRADLIVEERGRLWLVDHKSVGNFPSQLDLDFDPQIDRYTWALRQEGVPIYGQLFNQARRKMLKRAQTVEERHRRPRTHRTDRELDSIANDLLRIIHARYEQQIRLEGRSAHPEVAPVDAPRQASSRHCSYLCDFTEACLSGRKGNDSRQYLVELGMTQNFTRH